MALILTYKIGLDGPIHINNEETGEHMTIDIIELRGRQAKVALTFPDHYSIQRDVVYLRELNNEH